MKVRKIVLLTSLAIATVVGLSFLGLRMLTRRIVESRDCEWANIDHIELLAKMDIPSVIDSHCDYDAVKHVRQSVFTLDTSDFVMSDYIAGNHFIKLTSADGEFPKMDIGYFDDTSAYENPKALYWRKSDEKDASYFILLNAESGKLWVNLHYSESD
jgi:hypothetical protein